MNRLGNSGLLVGEIGLGCMSLGTEEEKAVSLIHQALDRGVNLLDTADLYDAGRNEELVGKAVQGRRDRVVIATKVGNRRIPGQEGWVWDPSKAYILSAVRESLRRLGTDYIDLYQLHGGTIGDPIDETIEAFEQLKREGLIREYGISSIRPNVIREYASRSSVVSVMNQYSILDRRAEETVLPLLQERGIGVIARGPVASGRLAEGRAVEGRAVEGRAVEGRSVEGRSVEGRAVEGRSVEGRSVEGRSVEGQTVEKGYLDYGVEELLEVRERLGRLVTPRRSLAQLAIRYSLSHPAVAAAIPGASSAAQLEHNLGAADVPPLTEDEVAAIRGISKANVYADHR